MVVVSYSGKEINAKLVYYGPGLSGKTTNLEQIYKSVPSNSRGKMVSMKTRTERTLFFDFLPVDLGQLGGFKTRFLLYTVPGQVYYNATRKLVLRGVDAVVFVADSERGKMKENIESLQNLRDNLKDYDLDLDKLPWVIQYNKRDLEDVYSIEELEEALNPAKVPWFEATAFSGEGVFETFRGVGKVLLQKLSKEVKLEDRPSRVAEAGAAAAEAPAAAEPPAPATPEPAAAPEMKVVSSTSGAETPPGGPGGPGGMKPETPMETASAPEPPAPTAPEPMEEPLRTVARDEAAPMAAAEPSSMEASAPAMAEAAKPAFGAMNPSVPSPSRNEEEDSPGFLSRLFGRGKKKEIEEVSRETRAARVDIPLAEGASNQGPTFIERRVQVPVTLKAEDLVHGAVLRLVLEVKVEAAQSEDRDSRAA